MNIDIAEIEKYATYSLIGIAAVTPVTKALMTFAHWCHAAALATQNKWDDKVSAWFVKATESVHGSLVKLSAFLPRISRGTPVSR